MEKSIKKRKVAKENIVLINVQQIIGKNIKLVYMRNHKNIQTAIRIYKRSGFRPWAASL